MKVADGIVLREARRVLSGVQCGRARASIVRERAPVIMMSMKNDVVARELDGGRSECVNEYRIVVIG